MENWEVGFASELKKRDNPHPIGACLGEILAIGENWKVAIKDGQIFIDKTNGYICRHILQRVSRFHCDTQKQSGNISVSCEHGGGSYNANGTAEGHIILDTIDDWQPGNKVKVTPDETGQRFFIDDIVEA